MRMRMLRRARPWDCACVCEREREESVSPSVPPSSACERSAAVRARCLLPACPVSLSPSPSSVLPLAAQAGLLCLWQLCCCGFSLQVPPFGLPATALFTPSRGAFRLPPFFLPPHLFLTRCGIRVFFLRQDLLTFPLVFLILDALVCDCAGPTDTCPLFPSISSSSDYLLAVQIIGTN